MNRGTLLALSGLFLLGACRQPAQPGPQPKPQAETAAAAQPITLFIAAQLHNTTEPCGCTSTPLGDVARVAALVRAAGERGILLDAGGLRYKSERLPPEQQHQARLKADFLEKTWQQLGAVTALQASDLAGAEGLAELAGATRVLSNLTPASAKAVPAAGKLLPEVLRTVGGVRLGILGLADPEEAWPPGLELGAPVAAARQATERLRAQGAQAVIALTGLRRDAARRMARQVPGIDLIVAGGERELTDGVEQAEQVEKALLVVPAQEGQRLVRATLHLQAGAPVWTLLTTAAQREQAALALRQKLELLQKRRDELRKDPQAEPAFVRSTETELERLKAELGRLTAQQTPQAVADAGYVTIEQVRVARSLERDPEVAKAMSALDRQIGEANLGAVSGPPPAPSAGQAGYVGMPGCQGTCHFHDDAVEFWQKTLHAHAWKTLVDGGKELSYDCVRCHAAGFDEPGGSNLWSLAAWQRGGPQPQPAGKAATPDLRNVQCEVCHGPGSLHVSSPSKHKIPIARPSQDRCLTCHTKEHSDTFDFTPYLRDILGPGHGAERRTALGEGPTGHELRRAAQKKQPAAAH